MSTATRPNVVEQIFLDAIAARQRKGTTSMNISPRAAGQLDALDPGDCARILDHLRDHPPHNGVQIVDISVRPPHLSPNTETLRADTAHFKAFVSQHRDGSIVLISVVEARPRAP